MSPELEQAIRERIDLGHSKEQISEELRSAGYDDATIDQVYVAVSTGTPAAIPVAQSVNTGGTLIGFAEMINRGVSIAASQWKVFLLTFVFCVLAVVAFSLGAGLLATAAGMVGTVGVIVGIVAGIALLVFFFGWLMVLLGGLLRAILYRDQNLKLGEHISWMRQRFWSAMLPPLYMQFITTNALYVLMVYGLIVAGFLALQSGGLGMMAMQELSTPDANSGLLALLLLLAIPVVVATYILLIYLSVKVGWAMMVFVTGRAQGIATLTESAALVEGRVWPVFWRMIGLGVLMLIALLMLDAILAGALDLSQDAVDGFIALAQIILFPVMVGVGVALYESLTATATEMDAVTKQQTHKRMKIGVWTGAFAMLIYFGTVMLIIAFAAAMMLGGIAGLEDFSDVGGLEPFTSPNADFQGAVNLSPEEQAELEAFLQQYEAELESF